MFVKPMPQPLLYGSRQLQDKVHKTQGLEDFKMASGIRDDMRSTATKLFKRQCVTRLVGKTGTGLRDRKSTRLNSSHSQISYAVFCLKKKIIEDQQATTDALSRPASTIPMFAPAPDGMA